MNPRRKALLRRIVLGLDAAAIVASMVLAARIQSALQAPLGFQDPVRFSEFAATAYATLPLFLGLVGVMGLHRCFERTWTRFELGVELAKLHLLGFFGLSGLLFVTQGTVNRSLLLVFLACTFALMYATRRILARWAGLQHALGNSDERVLLVGEPTVEMSAWLAGARRKPFGPRAVGLLCANAAPAVPGLPVRLGDPAALDRVLHEEAVDQVLFFPPLNRPDVAVEALRTCEGVGVGAFFAVDLVYRYVVAPEVVSYHERPFITFDPVPRRAEAVALKHAFDFAVALLAVIALAPLLLAIAAAVRGSMGAPVLFVQERVGRNGRRFKLLKFRTMVPDAEARRDELAPLNEMSGPVFKIAEDPRVTPLGRFLRRWSLDELPQLLNVVAGSMSLVGPRPLPVPEQLDIDGWYRRRLSMRPGITGLWQVSGRSDVDFDEWMRLDLHYVDEWSLRLDLLILARTLPAVLSRRGAR
jgi:exopolysaccharide biosynthesis polyprenyl glycosylphosphotransferase